MAQVFFTHFHSDHTVGFADFWLTSWIPAGGARTSPLTVTGPTGVESLVEGHRIAFANDIKIRMADQNLPKEGADIIVRSFAKSGVVFEENGLTVTSFDSDHGEAINPNWGYKIEYEGRCVVISGDVNNDPAIGVIAADVDLLLHSLGAARPELMSRPDIAGILQHHTTPRQAAKIFAASRPKLAVLVHMVLLGRPGFPPLTEEEVLAMTGEDYDGPIVIATDLMRFHVGEDVQVEGA